MLCTLEALMKEAQEENWAVGSFTCPNMEIAMGTVRAAEEANMPVIIQIAEGRLKHSPLHYLGPMMVQAAKQARVRICVHLDHGLTLEKIAEALSYGFSSVMYDGSRLPLEENIRNTNLATEIARAYGASIEAELGAVGGKEATEHEERVSYTDVKEAEIFVRETKIDALAVAIGNAHGHYAGVPNLNFERLKALHQIVDKPLVLHGGSGITDEGFLRCIRNGIRKINIATANLDAMVSGAKDYLKQGDAHDFYHLNERMREAVYNNAAHYIKVFANTRSVDDGIYHI